MENHPPETSGNQDLLKSIRGLNPAGGSIEAILEVLEKASDLKIYSCHYGFDGEPLMVQGVDRSWPFPVRTRIYERF